MQNTSLKIDRHHSQAKITDREQQVLHLIAYELTSAEIAQRLYISVHTALSHRKRLLEKLHVKNTAGIVRRGFELGYLTLPTDY